MLLSWFQPLLVYFLSHFIGVLRVFVFSSAAFFPSFSISLMCFTWSSLTRPPPRLFKPAHCLCHFVRRVLMSVVPPHLSFITSCLSMVFSFFACYVLDSLLFFLFFFDLPAFMVLKLLFLCWMNFAEHAPVCACTPRPSYTSYTRKTKINIDLCKLTKILTKDTLILMKIGFVYHNLCQNIESLICYL